MAYRLKFIRWLKTRTANMHLAGFQLTVIVFVMSICLACASSNQKTPENGVLQDRGEWLTQADVMPTYEIVPPQPRLPKMLSGETEIDANTTIEFYVDEWGLVDPILTNIKKSSGFDTLDRIALQWAKKITFKPGMHQGKPVKVILSKEIQWMLR